MSVETRDDLNRFHEFVGEQIAAGVADLAPDQVLAMWRERMETVKAVREGLEAVEVGRTRPLDQFADDFRRRHNVPDEE